MQNKLLCTNLNTMLQNLNKFIIILHTELKAEYNKIS